MTARKDLAQFVSCETKTFQNKDKLIIKYTSPNYSDPNKEWSVGRYEEDLHEDIYERVIGLSIGDKFCLHTEKDPENPKFNILIDVTDAKDAPAKNTSGYKGKGSYKKDDTGSEIQGCWKNVLEMTALKLMTPKTPEEAANLVWEHLLVKRAQEKKLRALKASEEPLKDPETGEPKKLSKLEQAKLKKQQELDAVKQANENKPVKTTKKKPVPVEEVEEDLENDPADDDDNDPEFGDD